MSPDGTNVETRPRPVLEKFPAKNKDNFRCYHDQQVIYPIERNNVQRGSIYSTLPDPPLEQRIVNEPKPQPTLRYLTIRGKQYSLQTTSQRPGNATKRQRISNGSARPS